MVREMSDPERLGEWTQPLEAKSPKMDKQQERYIPLITPLIPELVKFSWQKVCKKKKRQKDVR